MDPTTTIVEKIMRFLIDVSDLPSPFVNKFTRVLAALLTELMSHDGIAIQITSKGVLSIPNAPEGKPLDSWDIIGCWHKRDAVSLFRASKLMLLYLFCNAMKNYLPAEMKNGLAWNFAYSIENFSPVWRKRFVRFVGLDRNFKLLAHFNYWLTERGLIGEDSLSVRGDNIPTAPISVTEQDILVLAGVSWRHDTDNLKRLKECMGFKLVVLIYDLLPIDYPSIVTVRQREIYKNFLSGVGCIADIIVTPSPTHASRLQRFYSEKKINAARIAPISISSACLNRSDGTITQRLIDFGLAGAKFVLCVSDLRDRAHVLWLYALCSRLRQKDVNFPLLVIAGRVAHRNVLETLSNDPAWGISGIFIEAPQDEELSWLYKHSQFCLQPSFEGGCGMSVMEAVKYGRCIAADSISLIEASRGYAEHLPRDEPLWIDAIYSMLEESKFSNAPAQDANEDGFSVEILTQIADLLKADATKINIEMDENGLL